MNPIRWLKRAAGPKDRPLGDGSWWATDQATILSRTTGASLTREQYCDKRRPYLDGYVLDR